MAPRQELGRLGSEAVYFPKEGGVPMVERRDTSLMSGQIVDPRRRSTAGAKPLPVFELPPDHPEIQRLFHSQSKGKFYTEHPFEHERVNNLYKEFVNAVPKEFRPPFEFRVRAELAPNCQANRAWFKRLAYRFSVSDPLQKIWFNEEVISKITPIENYNPDDDDVRKGSLTTTATSQ